MKRSDKQIDNIVKNIQENTDNWLDFLAKTGYEISYREDMIENYKLRKYYHDTIKRIDKVLRKKSLDDATLKSFLFLRNQTLAQIDNNVEKHMSLLNKAPMVKAFRKFIQDNILDATKVKRDVKDDLGFLPDEPNPPPADAGKP